MDNVPLDCVSSRHTQAEDPQRWTWKSILLSSPSSLSCLLFPLSQGEDKEEMRLSFHSAIVTKRTAKRLVLGIADTAAYHSMAML